MKTLFSGIQPSGVIHLGNYIGALKQWVELQEKYDALFCIVDLHAMTVFQEPKTLRQNTLNTAKTLLALGIDPVQSIIFAQSTVSAHTELYWILNTLTKVSELELMTQYKDKSHEQETKRGVFAGLLNYPVLMAADILLYNAHTVPVGDDQVQHIELARELARRFNNLYSKTFTEPSPLLQKTGARIMGLDDPSKKMSKSASSPANYIALTDTPDIITDKIKRAVTDSGSEIKYNPAEKPGISNLLSILSIVTGKSISALEKKLAGSNYGAFKKEVTQTLIDFLAPFQKKYDAISDTKAQKVLTLGAKKAAKRAEETMEVVYKKVGLK